jgi:hypothetical protein
MLRGRLPARLVHQWLSRRRLDARTLPRDLKADDWATLFHLYRECSPSKPRGISPPGRPRRT